MHTISDSGQSSNENAEKGVNRFLEDFIKIISSRHFAHLKETDGNVEEDADANTIDVIVKSNHYSQIIYWVKKNLMVKEVYSKRKSYITTIDIILFDGNSLKIKLV